MSSKAKTIALRLLRKNRGTRKFPARSWRQIAREDYNGQINHATLNRFANSEGEWIPKDEGLQIVLGLKRPRRVKPQQPQALFDMATSTLRQALIDRKPMPPVDPRIIKQFVRLGWLTKTEARNIQ